MKVGDLVRIKTTREPHGDEDRTGVITRMFEKKCWRTHKLGARVNWDLIDPEPHAEVLVNENVMSLPASQLKIL